MPRRAVRDVAVSRYAWPVILSKTQRNDLYQVIESLGLRIGEFRLTEHEVTESSGLLRWRRQIEPRWKRQIEPHLKLIHLPSGMQIHLAHYLEGQPYVEETYAAELFIGQDLKKQMLDSSMEMPRALYMPHVAARGSSWGGVLAEVRDWLRQLAEFRRLTQRDGLMPDLWDEFRHSKELVISAPQHADDNSPFVPEERAAISAQIQDIKEYIKEVYEISGEQMSRIEERLDAAEESSHRIGRKDWVMAFNGAVFSLILSDLISQEAAQHILVMALTGLGHLFGIGEVPPSIPPIA